MDPQRCSQNSHSSQKKKTESGAKRKLKLSEFRVLKAEIDTVLSKVQKKLNGVKDKIKANIWSVSNKDGLLTSNKYKYLGCI